MLQTFLIVDLAGFTALTEAHGDALAADMAAAFVDEVRARLERHEAREVKTMGDAVLVHLTDAARGLGLAACVIDELSRRHGRLAIRGGLHTGSAVKRGEDWFGMAVNVAARVAALAGPDEVVVTQSAVEAAGDSALTRRLRPLGSRQLKNLSTPVHCSALRSLSESASLFVVDPVCRMRVRTESGFGWSGAAGRTEWFCSAGCLALFELSPETYGAS